MEIFFICGLNCLHIQKLVPGIYTLNTSMTAKEMMVVMAGKKKEEPDSVNKPQADDRSAVDEEGTAEVQQ